MKVREIIPAHRFESFKKYGHARVSDSFFDELKVCHSKYHFPQNLELRLERYKRNYKYDYNILVVVPSYYTKIDYAKETFETKNFLRRADIKGWYDFKRGGLIRKIGKILKEWDLIKLKIDNT